MELVGAEARGPAASLYAPGRPTGERLAGIELDVTAGSLAARPPSDAKPGRRQTRRRRGALAWPLYALSFCLTGVLLIGALGELLVVRAIDTLSALLFQTNDIG